MVNEMDHSKNLNYKTSLKPSPSRRKGLFEDASIKYETSETKPS